MKQWLFLLLLMSFTAQAGVYPGAAATTQQANNSNNNTETAQPAVRLPNPQATVKQFINAMTRVATGDDEAIDKAIATLDLSKVSPLIQEERGQQTARLLFSVIQLGEIPKLEDIPTSPKLEQYTLLRSEAGNVVLRINDQNNWLFSTKTVDRIPAIFDVLTQEQSFAEGEEGNVSLPASVQLRAQMPAVLKQGFLLEYWQWVGLFLIIVVGSIADKVLAWILKVNVSRWQKQHPAFETLDSNVLRPLGGSGQAPGVSVRYLECLPHR